MAEKIKNAPVILGTRVTEEGGIEISWTEAENADKYAVKRADSYKGKYSIIGWTKDCTFEDKEAERDKTYWYSIFAVKVISKHNRSVKSSGAYGAVVSDIPAPDNFRTEIGESEEIRIFWDYEGDADKYLVMRKNDLCSKMIPVAITEEKLYVDSDIVTGQVYHYCVQPLWIKDEPQPVEIEPALSENDSEAELEEKTEALPSEPSYKSGNFSSIISLVHLDCGEILSCKAKMGRKAEIVVRVVAGAQGYILERSEDGKVFEEVAVTQSGVSHRFTDKLPSGMKSCCYRTRSFRQVGQERFVSPASEAVKLK